MYMHVGVCVHICACVCAHMCVYVCVGVYVGVGVHVHNSQKVHPPQALYVNTNCAIWCPWICVHLA